MKIDIENDAAKARDIKSYLEARIQWWKKNTGWHSTCQKELEAALDVLKRVGSEDK